MAAATKHRIAKSKAAKDGVTAPTTRSLSILLKEGTSEEPRTGRGGQRQDADQNANKKLLGQGNIDSWIDYRDCAAAVVSGLHGRSSKRSEAVFPPLISSIHVNTLIYLS